MSDAESVASDHLWPMDHSWPDATEAAEIAALVVVLAARRRAAPAPASGYEAWRAGRLAALRAAR